MYSLYQIINNIVLFISKDLVYKLILPVIFILLVFNIISYLFSKDAKKENILDALKAKAIGFTVLICLPFILLWFLGAFQKVTGVAPNVDTSVLQKLIGNKNVTQTSAQTPAPAANSTVTTINPANK